MNHASVTLLTLSPAMCVAEPLCQFFHLFDDQSEVGRRCCSFVFGIVLFPFAFVVVPSYPTRAESVPRTKRK